VVAPDPHEVDGAEQAACLRDRLCERGERARPVLEAYANGRAEGRGWCTWAPSVADESEEAAAVMLEGSGGAPALASGIRPIGAVGLP
jgi:hypothetical protein